MKRKTFKCTRCKDREAYDRIPRDAYHPPVCWDCVVDIYRRGNALTAEDFHAYVLRSPLSSRR